MSYPEHNSTSSDERIKDMAMIDSRVRKLAEQIFSEKHTKYQNVNELLDELFAQGLMELLASKQEPEEVEEKFLVDDEFKYTSWQLNLQHYTDNIDEEWVDIKSTILRHGLKKVANEL